MTATDIALGLLDVSHEIGDISAARQFRELSLSWARYGYRDVIFEGRSVNAVLAAASDAGFPYCFILPYGYILAERWQIHGHIASDCLAELKRWITGREFLLGGTVVGQPGRWFGLERGCLLVDVETYWRLGSPAFDLPCEGSRELPRAQPEVERGRIACLHPTDDVEVQCPQLWGWNFISTSLQAGLPVSGLTADVLSHTLNLEAEDPDRRVAFLRYSGENIMTYAAGNDTDVLSSDQRALLETVRVQAGRARRGVFLWNIESYADIETPSGDFPSSVSTLYCVAAGFKPNRILQTHGFHSDTKVVFFDYSPAALDVRRCLVDQWNGEDFPDFVRYLFDVFPYPATFYQLWNGATPDDVNWDDVVRVWKRELQRWGGAKQLKQHWQKYRHLSHEYILSDVLNDPTGILDRIDNAPGAIIWWSNAFFTMYGNWLYSIKHRREAYKRWIEQLATRNPHLYLLGSDVSNTSVNGLPAAEYWSEYGRSAGDDLVPCKLYRTAIRM